MMVFLQGGQEFLTAPAAVRLTFQWHREAKAPEAANSKKIPGASCHKLPKILPARKAVNLPQVCTSSECFLLGKSTLFKESVAKIFLIASLLFTRFLEETRSNRTLLGDLYLEAGLP